MRSILFFGTLLVALAAGGATAAPSKDKADVFFNGKNLDGWEGLIEKYWSVKDAAIVGYTAKDPGFNTFLCSKKKYKDFELTFKVRLKDGKGNSGVQIRSKLADNKKFAVTGPQADIGEGYWGSLYGEGFGGMMREAAKGTQKNIKAKEFNDYSIRCVGKKVTIKINGKVTVDEEFKKMPEEGIIAFQLHAGYPTMEVTFKDIKFRELKSEK
jgi:hypothetical protein